MHRISDTKPPASTAAQEQHRSTTNDIAAPSVTRLNSHLEYSRSTPPGRLSSVQSSSYLTPNRIIRHQRSGSKLSQSTYESATPVSHTENMSAGGKTASLQIDVLIVGGGIAGLACAYALGQSGHRVRVLERSSGLHQPSGGIRIPPNLTKILLEWGLQDELSKAQNCRKSAFRSLETGRLLGYLEWQEDVIRETGGDFLLMHYDDLHQMLYKLALSVGTVVSFNATITSVSIDRVRERPSIKLENGSILAADIVIGADGSKSLVREVVNGREDNGGESGQSFYTITIPPGEVKNDPDLSQWANVPEWPIWMGDSRSVLGYPIRSGEEFCLHVYWPDSELRVQNQTEEGWATAVSTADIILNGLDLKMKHLLTLAPVALRTKYIKRELIEDWVDETGRIVLIGEAAHPLLPCTMHGPSLAVEDAVVLGVLMSRLRRWEQIPQLMEAFQDIRQGRCNHVHLSELNNASLVTMPPGEHRDMRDAAMKLSLHADDADWNDGRLREQWEEIGEVFGYNAREAAEDWWIKWGVLTDSTKTDPLHEPIDLVYEITQVKISA